MEINKNNDIPQYVIDSFVRIMLPEIQKFYESKDGQKHFEEWKDEQKKVNPDIYEVKP